MSHTVDTAAGPFRQFPVDETTTTLSGLTSGSPEDVLHGHGVTGTVVDDVSFTITTRPTDNSIVSMAWESASDSTTNDTCRLRFYSSSGDLTGAVVKVFFMFRNSAAGGLS